MKYAVVRLGIAALASGFAFSTAMPVMAQPPQKGGQNCVVLPNGQRQCNPAPQRAQPAQPGKSAQRATPAQPPQRVQAQEKSQVRATERHRAPAVGDYARRAPLFKQSKNSRLPPPPPHQHYRVIDGMLVRVDDTTLRVMAVVGLLDALTQTR